MKILLIIGMMLIIGLNTNAQNIVIVQDNELLIYTKAINSQNTVIIQNDSSIKTYTLESEECEYMTTDGRYIVVSQKQPTTLKIIHLHSQKTVFEMQWLTEWVPCEIRWRENDVLVLLTFDGNRYIPHDFKFEDLTLNSISRPQPVYPNLPYFTPFLETGGDRGVRTFYLQNPANPDIYVYDACFIESLYLGEECPYGGQLIYDLSTDTVLAQLFIPPTRMDVFYVETSSQMQIEYYSLNYDIIGWSPNGRYLAYFDNRISTPIPDGGQIIIYDLQENRYIEDMDNLYPFNFNRRILWSNSNILLIWKTGLFLAEMSDYNDSRTQFTFYNPATQTGVNSVDIFDVLRSEAVFSPGGSELLIIGKPIIGYEPPIFESNPTRADLILISTTTGESTVIDTDVTEIITWRSICDFTASDTASLISTMQTEPYSVICLDENGQYDLTAPLPDVAGDITIIGNGSTITMTGQNRILNVVYNQQWSRNGSLTLKNVTLSGGNATEGGAIYNAGDLTLENVILENHSAVRGGAIYNIGNLVMNGGAIQNNSASQFGGGIYNVGDMQLDGVNIRENNAPEGSGVYQGG